MNLNKRKPIKADCSTHMTTLSGRYINPRDLKPGDLFIMDIAAGLAKECRFAGQCKGFYSVAQHSVYVAGAVWHATKKLHLAQIALLHDAPEGLIADLVRCVKSGLPDYKDLEYYIFCKVVEEFELLPLKFKLLKGEEIDLPPEVQEADMRMLVTERRDLIVESEAIWDLQESYKPYDFKIEAMDWKPAQELFLRAYRKYFLNES